MSASYSQQGPGLARTPHQAQLSGASRLRKMEWVVSGQGRFSGPETPRRHLVRDDKSMPGRPQTSSFCVALLLFFQKGIVYMGGGVVNESCPINPKCLIWGTDTKKVHCLSEIQISSYRSPSAYFFFISFAKPGNTLFFFLI